MAGWNGSGTYSRYHDWSTDEAGAVNIDATRMDQEDDAIAAGINACLTKNGENSPSANLPMANFKHTGVGAGTARTHYADVASAQDSGYLYAASSGTDTYTGTLAPAITAYATGQSFLIKFGITNTGAATINLNGVGAKSLVKNVSTALAAGDLVANKLYRIVYDGTNFQVEVVQAAASESASGIVELATTAEAVTGTDTSRAVTAAGITAHLAAPKPIGSTTPSTGAFTTLSATGAVTGASVAVTGAATSSSASAGIGYATGAGGTQTQGTSKATAVTLDKICGKITTHAANLNANTEVSFTFTNSAIDADDLLVLNYGGGGTVGAYSIAAVGGGSGSRFISIRNVTAGNLAEAIDIWFAVIKGVVA